MKHFVDVLPKVLLSWVTIEGDIKRTDDVHGICEKRLLTFIIAILHHPGFQQKHISAQTYFSFYLCFALVMRPT